MKEPNPPAPFPRREGGEANDPSCSPPLLGEGPGEGSRKVRYVVRGQRVDEGKLIRAKQLRREMTPAERVLWEKLRRNQLAGLHFRRQQIVFGFIADFYCHATALIVELDGGIHEAQQEYDADRTKILTSQGFLILRFRNSEVFHSLDDVLTTIATTCQQRLGVSPKVTNDPERE